MVTLSGKNSSEGKEIKKMYYLTKKCSLAQKEEAKNQIPVIKVQDSQGIDRGSGWGISIASHYITKRQSKSRQVKNDKIKFSNF